MGRKSNDKAAENKRIGLLECTLKVAFDDKEYSVAIKWQICASVQDAAAALRMVLGEQKDPGPSDLKECKLRHEEQ